MHSISVLFAILNPHRLSRDSHRPHRGEFHPSRISSARSDVITGAKNCHWTGTATVAIKLHLDAKNLIAVSADEATTVPLNGESEKFNWRRRLGKQWFSRRNGNRIIGSVLRQKELEQNCADVKWKLKMKWKKRKVSALLMFMLDSVILRMVLNMEMKCDFCFLNWCLEKSGYCGYSSWRFPNNARTSCILHFYLTKKRKGEKQRRIQQLLEDYKYLRLKWYTYAEVKRITDRFKHKLGQEGYRTVFKGKFMNDILVVVKILNNIKGNGAEFMNEVGTIGKIHCVNVVRLIGYRQALVYEFLENDLLEKYISLSNQSQTLGWEKLHKIALDIAKGIDHLLQNKQRTMKVRTWENSDKPGTMGSVEAIHLYILHGSNADTQARNGGGGMWHYRHRELHNGVALPAGVVHPDADEIKEAEPQQESW
ncbi:hypothetical protein BUALT_Bualt01G0079800 [Buddleja alternifolia]|uniref:Tyrosine-protein kinase catalytic domain-containing protein n=1 Tax=Buddleja alternifolia TaxID=168488 RepID=A0AAV6Y6C1_9LAMI|nr:hypothetical protein BUALT_Bualt01G0079800 [Buddleja alternifolia]